MAHLLLYNDTPWELGSFEKCVLRIRHLVRKEVGAGLIRQYCHAMRVLAYFDISLVLVVHYRLVP